MPTKRTTKRRATLRGRGVYQNRTGVPGFVPGAPRAPPAATRPQYSYNRPGPWGRYGRAIGGAIGGQYGGPTGALLGSAAGGLAHYVGRIFGSGEYKIGVAPKYNSLFASATSGKGGSRELTFSSVEQGIRVRHKEYVCDVISSATAGGFAMNKYAINPARSDVFPWLSNISANFCQYTMKGCVFEFRSTSATALNSVNTQLGSIIMASNYNVNERPFETKQEMMNSMASISGKVSDSLIMGVECDPKLIQQDKLYIDNPNTRMLAGDRRLIDLADVYVATTGCQGTSVNVGQLHIIYDIILHIPNGQAPGDNVPGSVWDFDPAACLNSNPIGDALLTAETWGTDKTRNDMKLVVKNDNTGASRTYFAFPPSMAGRKVMITWTAVGSVVNDVILGAITLNKLSILRSNAVPDAAPNTGIKAAVYSIAAQLPDLSNWNMLDYRDFQRVGGTAIPWFSLPASCTYPAALTHVSLSCTEIAGDLWESVN